LKGGGGWVATYGMGWDGIGWSGIDCMGSDSVLSALFLLCFILCLVDCTCSSLANVCISHRSRSHIADTRDGFE